MSNVSAVGRNLRVVTKRFFGDAACIARRVSLLLQLARTQLDVETELTLDIARHIGAARREPEQPLHASEIPSAVDTAVT